MSGMRPQPQVGEDFLDDLGLVNKGDDAHGAPTPDATADRLHTLS